MGMNTNLQAAFERVLETAMDHDVYRRRNAESGSLYLTCRSTDAETAIGCFMII